MTLITERPVRIDYTNWRGVRALRVIMPLRIYYGATEYHKEPQWHLLALDLEKGQERDFAMKDIHSWEPQPPQGFAASKELA